MWKEPHWRGTGWAENWPLVKTLQGPSSSFRAPCVKLSHESQDVLLEIILEVLGKSNRKSVWTWVFVPSKSEYSRFNFLFLEVPFQPRGLVSPYGVKCGSSKEGLTLSSLEYKNKMSFMWPIDIFLGASQFGFSVHGSKYWLRWWAYRP